MTSSKNSPVTQKASHSYPWHVDEHLGFFEDIEPDYLYGRCLLTDVADNERSCWSFADDNLSTRLDRKVFPTVSSNLYMASSNASDTSVEFTISSLNAAGERVVLTASTDATNGQTPVLIGTGLDINFVFMSGDNQVNLGEVYFTNDPNFTAGVPNTPSSVLAHVPVGYGCSPQAMVTVPANKICVIDRIVITISRASGAAGSAVIHARVKRAGGSFVVAREWNMQDGTSVIPVVGMAFPAGTIVEFTIFDVSDSDTNVSVDCQFEYVEV